jgi:CheY-like chemotaxis protein
MTTSATIVVVDDDYGFRDTLEDVLLEDGHSVRVARNGAEALGLLPDVGRPALIFLDVQMPVMDGLTFLGHLRRRPDRDDFEVVIMSAGPDQLAEAPSAVRQMRKPLDLKDILGLVAGFASRHGGTTPPPAASRG